MVRRKLKICLVKNTIQEVLTLLSQVCFHKMPKYLSDFHLSKSSLQASPHSTRSQGAEREGEGAPGARQRHPHHLCVQFTPEGD